MFWGCFSGGLGKGPCLIWEKDWGTINKESYCDKIVPLIHGWMTLHPELSLMQNGAPGHSAQYTLDELKERGIVPIFWPPFSPDLNPIETIWNIVKNYLQDVYGDRKFSYEQLRAAIREAWESVGQEKIDELVDSMGARCQAVIDAHGMYTRF